MSLKRPWSPTGRLSTTVVNGSVFADTPPRPVRVGTHRWLMAPRRLVWDRRRKLSVIRRVPDVGRERRYHMNAICRIVQRGLRSASQPNLLQWNDLGPRNPSTSVPSTVSSSAGFRDFRPPQSARRRRVTTGRTLMFSCGETPFIPYRRSVSPTVWWPATEVSSPVNRDPPSL